MLLKRKPFIHVDLSIKFNHVLVHIEQYTVHILEHRAQPRRVWTITRCRLCFTVPEVSESARAKTLKLTALRPDCPRCAMLGHSEKAVAPCCCSVMLARQSGLGKPAQAGPQLEMTCQTHQPCQCLSTSRYIMDI